MILDICTNPTTLRVFRIVRIIIDIIKIVVPIILIISLMVDLMGEVTNDEKDFSKVSKLIVMKILAAILIFLIPTIVGIIARTTGFNTNSYVSCLENATDENIEIMQQKYARKLLDININNCTLSNYTVAKKEINKIKDVGIRKQMMSELEVYKKAYDEHVTLEKEQMIEDNTTEAPKKDSNASDKVKQYVQYALDFANDNTHGYCNRPDCNQLQYGDVDCGTFVSYALRSVDLLGKNEFMNPNDPNLAIATLTPYGFEMYAFDPNNLKYGDIVITYGHTGIYVGDNQIVAANGNSPADGYLTGDCGCVSGPLTQSGDQNGQEVSVGGMGSFTNIIRYVK